MSSIALLPRKIERENSYLARHRFARIRVMRLAKIPWKIIALVEGYASGPSACRAALAWKQRQQH
jgi:hypothetical protein